MKHPRRSGPLSPKVEITRELIRKLPKTDLHCHLDGSLRMETVLELMKGNRGERGYYPPAEAKRLLAPGKKHASLVDYLKGFEITLSVMQTREALMRIAYELAQDCAEENVRYVEVRYSPMLHVRRGLKLPEVVESVIAGLKKAERDFGVRSGIIICGLRNITPRWSYKLAQLAVEFKNQGVVGFDLAGAEKDFPAKDHRKAFALIINHFINSTVHAGEAFGPKSIAQAIRYCGAHRIGHGVRLREDPELLNFVTDHRIPLEICLSSNVQTGVVGVMKEHPFKFYYEYGVRVTLNTDNRLMSDTSMSQELYLACRNFNLSLLNLRDILINGFKSAFLPYNEKVRLLKTSLAQIDYLIAAGYPEMVGILNVHL